MGVYDILFAAYLVFVNFAAFFLMGADKRRAEKGEWRISERALFLPALLFGAVGGTAGMYVFRHKTKHLKFAVLFPLLAAAQIAAGVFVFIWI